MKQDDPTRTEKKEPDQSEEQGGRRGVPLVPIVSCEHAGNEVPEELRHLFRCAGKLLSSHRGYDIGTLEAGRFLAHGLGAPLFVTTISRLVVDCNRSLHHPTLFSRMTERLPAEERQRIIARHYTPHRRAVENEVRSVLNRAPAALLLSVHSFTPKLKNVVRNADIGLLYDPGRPLEKTLCQDWQQRLRQKAPQLLVRRNYPYRGVADGLCTSFRKFLPAQRFVGIELELNQKYFSEKPVPLEELLSPLLAVLQISLQAWAT